jgi:SAM-dependent methyltransferase
LSACPACGTDALRPWRSAAAADPRALRPAYELLRCGACGSAVTVGREVSDEARLYSGGVYAAPPRLADLALEPLRKVAIAGEIRLLREVPPPARVHEVGAGDGRLVKALVDRGYLATGSDAFAPVAPGGDGPALGRARAEATLPTDAFDAVVAWHVLEHLADPHRALSAAVGALRTGGRLIASVPNLDSVQARLGGAKWFHEDVPRHAVHFTRRGLLRLLDRAGFKVERIGSFVLDQCLLGIVQTLLNRLTRERNVLFRALKRDPSLRSAGSDMAISAVALVPAVLIGTAVETLAAAAGRGGALVVVARSTGAAA